MKCKLTKTARPAVTTVVAVNAATRVQTANPKLSEVLFDEFGGFTFDSQAITNKPSQDRQFRYGTNCVVTEKPKPSLWKSIFKLVGLLSVFGAVYVGFVLALAGRIS